jgi:pimeloyl-ACP methyl ester carboxylesterase
VIAFRGLQNLLDHQSLLKWTTDNHYSLSVFPYEAVDQAEDLAAANKDSIIDIIGFSRGARAAYELTEQSPQLQYNRLITIGTHPSVSKTFGNVRSPLPNVRIHLNFVEQFQQYPGFFDNPINVDLGNVVHLQAVKKTLELLDDPKYNK